MSFPRLGRLATTATLATPTPPPETDTLATVATTATPARKVAVVAEVATPADSEKQASIRVRLLCPDHAEELLAFWHDDHDDLLALSDEAILALAQDYLTHRDYYGKPIVSDDNVVVIDGVRVTVARPVRCAGCHWFERRTDHPHMGRCLATDAVAWLWDTDRRACASFLARP